MTYHMQVPQVLHDCQDYQITCRTIALCQECFYGHSMYRDIAEYVHNCSWCKIVKGHYTSPDTQWGSLIAHNPMDLLCIDFTRLDPLKNVKGDAFSKFS